LSYFANVLPPGRRVSCAALACACSARLAPACRAMCPCPPPQNSEHMLYPTCLSTMAQCEVSTPRAQTIVGCLRAMNALEFLQVAGGTQPRCVCAGVCCAGRPGCVLALLALSSVACAVGYPPHPPPPCRRILHMRARVCGGSAARGRRQPRGPDCRRGSVPHYRLHRAGVSAAMHVRPGFPCAGRRWRRRRQRSLAVRVGRLGAHVTAVNTVVHAAGGAGQCVRVPGQPAAVRCGHVRPEPDVARGGGGAAGRHHRHWRQQVCVVCVRGRGARRCGRAGRRVVALAVSLLPAPCCPAFVTIPFVEHLCCCSPPLSRFGL
jgi:hypothetical protein